ncbi:hypothetical protein ATCC90586_000337 [Pythium insidiosum]|nr:hypothetical protein ATCC90586_000337 [Pythium insidiosum]
MQLASVSPDAQPVESGRRGRLVVRVARRWYRVVWLSLWLTHAACAVFLGASALLYWYADHPYLTYFADLIAPKHARHFRAAGALCFALAALHVASWLEMLALSALSRRLVLSRDEFTAARQSPRLQRWRSSWRQLRHAVSWRLTAKPAPRVVRYPWQALRFVLWACCSRQGLLGIDSPLFELMFTVREGLEVASQTYQARQLSERIASQSLNSASVALLVVNCWSTPLLQHSLRSRPAVARCVCLAVDFAINASANMLVPWLILAPYVAVWDAEQFTYDVAQLYEDVWFGNMVMQHRMLFAASTLDVVSKLVPHLSMLLCLVSIRSLVRRASSPGPIAPEPSQRPSLQALKLAKGPPLRVLAAPRMDMRSRKAQAVHLAFVAWGVAVLAIHVLAHSVHRAEFPGCKQVMHPWFVATFACATLEVNCRRLPARLTPSDVLVQVHPANLMTLVFSHCDALEVPPEIRRFPSLLGVEIYNATLVSWPSHAALEPAIHKSIVFLLFIHVMLAELPPGVMGPLPDTLTDVELAFTNLTTLPEDLHERWHGMATFYFEYSRLQVFPRTLRHLPVYDLSLIGNDIESVPELAELTTAEHYTLALSRNPLQSLPDSVPVGVTIAFLMLEDTRLEALPEWVGQRVQERVFEFKDNYNPR